MPRSAFPLAAFLCLWTTPAAAADLPFSVTVQVGKPARQVQVTVANSESGAEVSLGAARHKLDGVQATSAELETVRLTGGGVIGLLTLRSNRGEHLILVGTKRATSSTIESYLLGLRGDPGERRGHVLLRDDIDGDGAADLRLVEQHEVAKTCDGHPISIRSRALNSTTMELGPAQTSLAAIPTGAIELAIADPSPLADNQQPRLQALRARWTTQDLAADEPLTPLASASGLTDGSIATATNLLADANVRAVFAVRAAPVQSRAIAFTVSGDIPKGALATGVTFRGDVGGWFHVTLPAPVVPGRRYVVSLPEALNWNCLEFAATSVNRAARLPLAEIELLTDLDVVDGLPRLVARLITDDREGPQVAALLVSLGQPGLAAVRAHWDQLGSRGKRRMVVALRDRLADADARAMLLEAARDPDAELAERAVAALIQKPDLAFNELQAAAEAGGELSRKVTPALGESGDPRAIGVLLALHAAANGDRADVRSALETAIAAAPDSAVAQVEAWLAQAPNPQARAASIQVLAGHEATRSIALQLWQALVSTELEFPELWRCIIGSARLAPSAEVDAWLVGLTEHDDIRWMLRDAALVSLGMRQSSVAIETALLALQDAYPRVRATAARMLLATPPNRAGVLAGFGQEEWPLVRSAVLSDLTPEDSTTIPTGALSDSSMQVRIAAISALRRMDARSAWPAIATRLKNNDEWPAVMSAALEFASALCITEATPDIKPVLKRGLKPDAWAPDVDLAIEAIDVLGKLGSDEARAVLRAVQTPSQPQAIRDAAARALTMTSCRRAPADRAPQALN